MKAVPEIIKIIMEPQQYTGNLLSLLTKILLQRECPTSSLPREVEREQIEIQENMRRYEVQKKELKRMEFKIENLRQQVEEYQAEEELFKINTDKLARLYN